MAQLIIPVTLGAEEQIWRFMTEQSKNEDRLQSPQPLADFYGEDRHELGGAIIRKAAVSRTRSSLARMSHRGGGERQK
jgi:hypothetical protein